MITRVFNSLGMDVPLLVPETIEEFDANAKKAGACLKEGIDGVVYRGPLAEFRAGFLHGFDEVKDAAGNVTVPALPGIEKITGIKRPTRVVEKATKDKDGNPETVEVWDQTEAKYFASVCSQLGLETPEAFKAKFQDHANAVAARIEFDASVSARATAGPKQIPKKYLEFADRKIAEGSAEKVAKRLSKLIGREVTVDRESIARAVQEDMQNEAKKREQTLMAI